MIFTVVPCSGQHIEEIRKKLFPDFDRVQWSQQYTMERDYTPVDYSSWESAPKAQDFYDAFIGYHILERFLRKRNNEITAKFDETAKTAFWNAHRKWEKDLKASCEHIWKPEQLGYSGMVLNYLYCLSSGFRVRVDNLGGGIPPNVKLDASAGWNTHILGSDQKAYTGAALTRPGGGVYLYSDTVSIEGKQGTMKLYFKNEKMYSIELQFESRYDALIETHLVGKFGSYSETDSDPVLQSFMHLWRGKEISLVMNSNGFGRTIILINFRKVKP